ncbi:MAG TPA: oligosaccharide flippase family protein [Steroidobacteraceae bacterium]|nr:oligosaccharide flippase family protein [Steroidobacteraceae bacterium]
MSTTPPEAPPGSTAPAKPRQSSARVLVRNVLSNWTGLVLNMAVALFMSPFLVRSLGDVWYGMWVLIRSTTGYMGMLDAGVRVAVVKFVARADASGESADINRTVSTAYFLYCCVTVVVGLGTVALAIAFPYIFKLSPDTLVVTRIVVLIAGVSLGVSLLSAVAGGILTGMQRFDISNQIGIATLIIRTIVIVAVILMGYGIIALAITHLAMQVMNWFVISWFARKIRPDIKVDVREANKESAKKLYGYGSANVISGLGDLLLFRTGEVLAAMFIGPAAVTYYAIAGTLLEYLQKLVITMAQTLHPFSSAKQAIGDDRSLQAVALVSTKLCFLIALPVTAGIVIFGHAFIGAWMGASYAAQAGPLLMAMAAGRLFWIAQSGTFQILLGAGRHQQAMIINVLTGAFSFLGGMLLIQEYGLLGMTIGAAIPVVVIHGIITPVYTMRTLKIPFGRYLMESMLRPIAASAPFVLALLAIQHWFAPQSLWSIAAAGLVASPVLVLSSYYLAFNREDRVRYLHRFIPSTRKRAA